MKKFLIAMTIIVAIIFVPATQYLTAATKDEMITVVRQAAQDYRDNTGFQGQCTIAGQPVSLAAYMYANAIQEGGYQSKSSWANNWFSLIRGGKLFKLKGTRVSSDSKKSPIYRTPYEGTYEAIHLIVTDPNYKKCNMDYYTVKAFISGPDAPDTKRHPLWYDAKGRPNATIKEWATVNLNKNLNNALLFDKKKNLVSDKPVTQKQQIQNKKQGFDVVTDEKKCTALGSTKAEWIQLDIHNPDTNTTELLDQKVLQLEGNEVIKLFKCWTVK